MSTNQIQNEKGLQIFENPEFGQIRTVEINGKSYFYATDIAKALGYAKPHNAIEAHCRYSLKQGVPHPQNFSKTIEVNVIPEGDVYRLITHSKLPNAERFEHWVFDEVLPTIRRHGMYLTEKVAHEAIENTELFLSRALLIAKDKIDVLQGQLNEVKPKILFADSVAASETSIFVGDLAKILKQNGIEIGQNRLFDWLRDNGYLMKYGGRKNMPTQKAMVKGLFEVEEKVGTLSTTGKPFIEKITKVTGLGQIYFVNLFKREVA